MKVVNALQLRNGAKAEYRKIGTLSQPIQFLLKQDKDPEWAAHNLDWLEMLGLKQIKKYSPKMLKNYKLANGIIDRTDYIVEEDNEMVDMIDILTRENESAYELKFFPIIPNVINVLMGEFAKRNDRITYRAVDDISFNEQLEDKRVMIEHTLVHDAEKIMQKKIQDMGIDTNSQEGQQKAQEMMQPEAIRSLPEIQQFFNKDYRSLYEQWANHQHNVDEERYYIKELETIGFKDSLTVDKEFWHFRMDEHDYDIEIWNPILTFYHKSPEARYISQGNYAGRFEFMTIADVIDKYGYLMNETQLRSLENIYPAKNAGYVLPGTQNMYDATKSYESNITGPSVAMRQHLSFNEMFDDYGDDILKYVLNDTSDLSMFNTLGLLRTTTAYWKSQKMVGWLCKVDHNGMYTEVIVDETYKITEKPEYDTTVIKQKSKENLVSGEHLEWIWINEVWGGIKVGPNRPSFYGQVDDHNLAPIYLKLKPIPFQFKGDFSLYGCKLPVEGSIFSERNSISTSLVDKMKPFQIGYNLVNNQMADILIDELGTVIVLDQNALPKHSMGEDWGHNNFAKAYVAMKNFSMLPLDTSITNTENGLNFNHYQVLNLEQTQRLMSRIQLAGYFKQSAFEAIGISPQRMGAVTSQETATGVEQAINMSYSQTDMYFVQHSEYLMPRIHQMRTELAQYYNSNKPSVRLQYMTSMDEKINFEINGTELLSRDINVFVSTKINQRQIMEQLRQLAIQNNASGASIYDLGAILKADSMAEMTHTMKAIEIKTDKIRQEQQAHDEKMQQQQIDAENQRVMQEQKYEAEQKALDRASHIEEAKIRSAGFGATQDINKNGQNDYIDSLEYFDKKAAQDRDHQFQREKELNKQVLEEKNFSLKEKELSTRETIANKQVQIALANKNKYDKKK